MNQHTQSQVPHHVAIVMDGNGRWAKKRHLPRVVGHHTGASAVRKAIQFCLDHNIKVLTLFALSIENFLRRPPKELDLLMHLFFDSLQNNIEELHSLNIRIRFIGDRTCFSSVLQQTMQRAEELTSHNSCLQLVIAMNYSGKWDIVESVRKVAERVQTGTLLLNDISQNHVAEHLSLSDLPDPDLLIRTSGEQRVSNFLLWQLAYTELYFSEVYWPDFDEKNFSEAVDFYRTRQRRFGYTDEQLNSNYT